MVQIDRYLINTIQDVIKFCNEKNIKMELNFIGTPLSIPSQLIDEYIEIINPELLCKYQNLSIETIIKNWDILRNHKNTIYLRQSLSAKDLELLHLLEKMM